MKIPLIEFIKMFSIKSGRVKKMKSTKLEQKQAMKFNYYFQKSIKQMKYKFKHFS